MFDYQDRQKRLYEIMDREGVDLVFLPKHSADMDYLTGTERRVTTFGNVAYTHHWVAGVFLHRNHKPQFVLPRMIVEFDSPAGVDGNTVVVSEQDDAVSIFNAVAKSYGHVKKIGVSARTWSETTLHIMNAFPDATVVNAEELVNPLRRIKSPEELTLMAQSCDLVDKVLGAVQSKVNLGVTELDLKSEINFQMNESGSKTESFDTAVWSMGPKNNRDASDRLTSNPLVDNMGVSFDFGAVIDGYCSDFGRTIYVGDPNEEYQFVYDLVMQAQAAGVAAVKPGALASDVHNATRQVIVDGGYGDWFRHRTGHCIGLDVHEFPFISEEDHTPLEVGMTFTIEPSVFWPGRVGVRVEDVIVVEENGGRKLNQFTTDLIAN
ncbi:MAG: Xaa-Pro peptidase family protein [Actinomycetia bacterium]|jgi:Xaa-Pro aminopeptidase|nr:Xaa-Pro peptidase family protein [Actinomycetes bacterium]MCH9830763.1 Xaa-Pro peptidase family protein [Actinomycetes bacterium]MCH9841553.1 Xaa-Pro peptidase family protein [Actinomycetes bacterium]